MQILKPKFFFEKIYDIKEDFLKENNIKALILDVDNTLTLHDSPDLNPEISQWMEKMKEENIPLVILSSSSRRRFVPTRQGVHLPQDSSTVNSRKNFAMSTIHVVSSITIRPPEPIIEPIATRLS